MECHHGWDGAVSMVLQEEGVCSLLEGGDGAIGIGKGRL